MVTVWWSAACLIHYSFLNPSKIITSEKYAQQIDEIHQKLQCLQLALFNRTGPILLHHITCPLIAQPTFQKLNELGYGLLPHLPCSPDLSPTDYLQASQQLSAGKMLPQPGVHRKCFPRVCWIRKSKFLCYRNKLISYWQKCIDCDGSYFINKDVFQPNYTDLKFRVRNHSYFSTNLVFEKGQVENFWERVARVYLLSHIEVRWVLTL